MLSNPTRRALLALAFFSALPLAACQGGQTSTPSAASREDSSRLNRAEIEVRLTQPVYSDIQRFEYIVEGGDGAQLWVNLYRPMDAEHAVPVILVKTPYHILSLDPTNETPYSPALVDYFAPRGYAVAFADVRGNYNSGGCIEQTGPVQWQDAYNIIEFLGGQDWSNGKVGMYGASYDGETQLGAALLNPPSLKTIIPTATVSNQYEYSFYDGVAYSQGAIPTNAAYLAISLVPGAHPNAVTTYPERLYCVPDNFANALDFSGDVNAYWQERDYRPGAPQIQASVLHIHGLQDWNVKPNHIDGWFNALTSEKRAIYGQWGHAFPNREDWNFIRHRWFDHYLYGINTGVLEDLPPVLIQNSDNIWMAADSFPPRNPELKLLHLNGDGSLGPIAAGAEELALQDVPQSVTGTELPNVGPLLSDLAGIPDRLIFETAELEGPLQLRGRPELELKVRTDAERTRWAVLLEVVSPTGQARWINRGYLNTRHLDGLDKEHSLTAGASYTATIRMFPQDDVVQRGERLRLTIRNVDDWIEQDTTFASSSVAVGLEGSLLRLPLAGRPTPVPPDRLREGL
ncbi:MAG: CocE/NonD family hydrolase [Oceanococcaceae bacterium]